MKNVIALRFFVLLLTLTYFLNGMENLEFEKLKTENNSHKISCMVFNEEDHLLFCGTEEGFIDVWNVNNPYKPTWLTSWNAHKKAVRILVLDPEKKILYSTASTGIKFWNIENLKDPQFITHWKNHDKEHDWFTSIAFHPKQNLLILGLYGGMFTILNVKVPKQPQKMFEEWEGMDVINFLAVLDCEKDLLFLGHSGRITPGVSIDIYDIKNATAPKSIGGTNLNGDKLTSLSLYPKDNCCLIAYSCINPNEEKQDSVKEFIALFKIDNPRKGHSKLPFPTLVQHTTKEPLFVGLSIEGKTKVLNLDSHLSDFASLKKYENCSFSGFDHTRNILFSYSNNTFSMWCIKDCNYFLKNYAQLCKEYKKNKNFDLKIKFEEYES